MRTLLFAFIYVMFLGVAATSNAANLQTLSEDDIIEFKLDSLEAMLNRGDKTALLQLEGMISSDKNLTRDTWYGSNNQSINAFAAEILKKYCSFEHMPILREIEPEEYKVFLRTYYDSIRYIPSLLSFSDVNSDYQASYRAFDLIAQDKPDISFRHFSDLNSIFKIKNPNLFPKFSLTDAKKNKKLLESISSAPEMEAEEEKYNNDYTIFQLGCYPSDQSLGLILHILRTKEINDIQAAINSLAMITNFKLFQDSVPDKFVLAQAYEDLRFQYESFEDMQFNGYKHLNIATTDSVQFYSALLDLEDIPWWNRINALPTVLKIKDSRVLPFLADLSLLYNILTDRTLKYNIHSYYLDTLKAMTQTAFQFKNENGGYSEFPGSYEIKWGINLSRYWHQHYREWSWSDAENCFVNPTIDYYEPVGLEKLVKEMASKDKKTAINGLIEFVSQFNLEDEAIINRDWYNLLVYEEINKCISSSFPRHNLLQFKVFLKYCDDYEFDYKIDKDLCNGVAKLLGYEEFGQDNNLTDLMLFKVKEKGINPDQKVELKLLSTIGINQIPKLIYLQYISKNVSWGYSKFIEELTDKAFQKHMDSILTTERYLKLYLKYLANYEPISDKRVQPYVLYENFNNLKDITEKLLLKIVQSSVDRELQTVALNILVNNIDPDFIFEDLPLVYIDQITGNAAEKLKFVPKAENYERIVNAIQNTDEMAKLRNYCTLLERHTSIEMVPSIMRIVDDFRVHSISISHSQSVDFSSHWSEEKDYVSTAVISILEDLYEYSYNYNYGTQEVNKKFILFAQKCWKPEEVAPYWKNQWHKDSLNYRDWGVFYHQEVIDTIKEKYNNSDSLTWLELNIISKSKFRKDSDTLIWKKLLSNLYKDDVEFLYTDSIFKLSSFENIQQYFTNKEAFFEIYEHISDTTLISLDKIYQDLQNFNEVDQGEIISELLELDVIRKAIINHPKRDGFTNDYIIEKVSKFREYYSKIINTKDTYAYGQSELEIKGNRSIGYNITNPPLYFIEMNGMDYSKKLEYTILNLRGREQRNYLRTLVDSVEYKDLPLVCKYAQQIDSISSLNYLLEKLSIKLGIPLFMYSLENIDSLDQILASHSEEEYIRTSAMEFYPDLFADQKLNYSIVADNLRSPLALNYDNKNHLEFSPILTLIRILELEHNTRLGYEYQFDRYDAKQVQSRIDAWLKFLEEKGLIHKEQK